MSHVLDTLGDPRVREAILAGVNKYYQTDGDLEQAKEEALRVGLQNGAALQVLGAGIADVIRFVIWVTQEWDKMQKEEKKPRH